MHQVLASHLLHVDLKRTLRLTLRTGSWLHLLVLGLEKWPQHKVTLVTVVLDHSELGENTGAAAYDTAGPNQLVQVELPAKRTRRRLSQEVLLPGRPANSHKLPTLHPCLL